MLLPKFACGTGLDGAASREKPARVLPVSAEVWVATQTRPDASLVAAFDMIETSPLELIYLDRGHDICAQ